MAEKNSLWKNIRKKAEQNRRTGAKPKKPTAEMLRQERKIKANQKADGGYLYAKGGQYLTVDGEYHRVYRNADGDIAVNHPKEDKGKWDTINLTDKSGANTIAEGIASVRKWHRENPSYAQGGYMYPDGGGINPGKQKAVASTTAVNTRALPEGLFEQVKANPPARQPEIINIVDKRKWNPVTNKPINPNRDLVGGKFEDTVINDIINSANNNGVDPYIALAIGLQESGLGKTDPNIGHLLYSNEDYIPGVDEMVSFIKEKENYAKKLGYKDKEHFIQAYNGLGKVFPETEQDYHGFKMKSIYGVPVPKEGIDLAKNPLYGKRIINIADSVLKQNPQIVRRVEYYKPKMDGGYMYYAGGPMYYDVGGKVIKNIGAGAYGILSGAIGAVTGGATNKFMDKGYNYLQKKASKNFDPNDPDDVKWAKSQDQFSGYGTAVGGIGAGILTGNVQGAIGQTATGLNKAFQASDWASDDFKKWSNISSTAIGIGAGLAGGNLNSAQSASKIGQAATKFGSQASKISPYANQALELFGGNEQTLLQQGVARQEYLNSPEYLAMKERENQAYVNQGLSFAANGGPLNNEKYLVNSQIDSMRNRYKTYKTKYSKGGKVQDNAEEKLEYFGMTKVPNYSGYHYENPNGGSYGGENASFEKNEIVLHAKGGSTPGPGKFVFPSEVNGTFSRPAFLEVDENGIPKPLNKTIAKFVEDEATKGSPFRKHNNLGEERVDAANQKAMEMVAYYDQLDQQQEQQRQAMVNGALQYAAAGGKLNDDITRIVEEEYATAYGGYIPKKYKGLNMPYSSGGKLPKEVLRARVEAHMSPEQADAYVENYAKGGGIHIKESKKGTFTAAAKKRGKSVQEFARQVLANKGNYSAAMVKKANFARNAAGWKHAHGGPVVSNVNQDFDLYAQNRGGMMMAQGGNMYAVGGPGDELDPEQLKAQGFVEYEKYFYNPTTGQYIDKPSEDSSESEARLQRFMQPGIQFDERSIKPLLGLVNNTGIEQMPIDTGMTTLTGGIKKPGMENVIGPDSYIEGTRYAEPNLIFNSSPENYSGKYNLQYVDPYTLGDDEMLDQRYPILDREGNVQLTPKDFNNLQTVGSTSDFRNKYFTDTYNQVMSTRDKVRRAYQNKSPYLDNMVDEPAKPNKSNTYLNNLNTPNYVDNQGNTSSIFSRRNKNKSTPVQPIKRMQSRNLQQLPTDNTVPGIIGTVQQMPGLSDYASTSLGEFSDQFTPEDVQYSSYLDKNKPAPMTGPVVSEDVKLTPEETAALQYQQKYSQPGQFTADLIDNQSNKTGLTNLYKNTPTTIVQPSQSDVTPTVFPQTGTSSTQTKQSNQPNQGLTGLDYASGLANLAAPLSQLYYGLKGPDDVNYERITGQKIDPTVAIALAAEEGRRAQDSAAYLMRQSAPTSGSYMNNLRNLSLQSGKQRGLQSAGLRYQADVANTQMQNQINAQNAQISMQEQIDRLQEKDAARTNVTEGLSGIGSSTANMIRDYRINQINQTIANNIGTNNYKFDPVNETITYRNQNGEMVTVPAQTVVGTNPVNIATGQMQQSQNLPFDPNFKFKRTNKYLQNPNG